MTTCGNLARLMEERGVSVRELSRRTGLSLASVRRLRRADMSGSLHTWALVARALECGVDELIRGWDDGGYRPGEGQAAD